MTSNKVGPLLNKGELLEAQAHLKHRNFQRKVEGGDERDRAVGPAVAMAGLPRVVAGVGEAARQEADLCVQGSTTSKDISIQSKTGLNTKPTKHGGGKSQAELCQVTSLSRGEGTVQVGSHFHSTFSWRQYRWGCDSGHSEASQLHCCAIP